MSRRRDGFDSRRDRHIEAHFKIPKLSSTGRHNLESNRKKGKIRKSGILGGENPQEVCFNMVAIPEHVAISVYKGGES